MLLYANIPTKIATIPTINDATIPTINATIPTNTINDNPHVVCILNNV